MKDKFLRTVFQEFSVERNSETIDKVDKNMDQQADPYKSRSGKIKEQ